MEEAKEIKWPERMKELVITEGEWKVIKNTLSKIFSMPLITIIINYGFSWCVDDLFDNEILQQIYLRRHRKTIDLFDRLSYKSSKYESFLYNLYIEIKGDTKPISNNKETWLDDLKQYLEKPFYSPDINKITISINDSKIIKRDILPLYGSYHFENLINSFLWLMDDVTKDTSSFLVDSSVSAFVCIESFDVSRGNSHDSLFINMNVDKKR